MPNNVSVDVNIWWVYNTFMLRVYLPPRLREEHGKEVAALRFEATAAQLIAMN